MFSKPKFYCVVASGFRNTSSQIAASFSSDGKYVIGFATKGDLLKAIKVDHQYHIEHDEGIRKIEIEL